MMFLVPKTAPLFKLGFAPAAEADLVARVKGCLKRP